MKINVILKIWIFLVFILLIYMINTTKVTTGIQFSDNIHFNRKKSINKRTSKNVQDINEFVNDNDEDKNQINDKSNPSKPGFKFEKENASINIVQNSPQESPQTGEINEYVEDSESDNETSNMHKYKNQNEKENKFLNIKRNNILEKEKSNPYKKSEISNLITNSKIPINSNKEDLQSIDYSSLKINDLGKGPIYASGWFKYFKFKFSSSKENGYNSNGNL